MTTPRPDSRADSRLGTDLGPYHIERVLGRGGMGVVYLAEQRELGRKVALKLLPDELAQDADFRARFERESRLAASIDHPNIVPLYEAGEIEGTGFLAMRYVDGVDLASRLRDGPLVPATALAILGQVAGALDAAHERGLVHRDVKPGNILLGRTAHGDHAYLTDFGLTKQTGSETVLTRAGSFMGTPAYMAPEQIQGQDVDGRADQYSLACVAFECLTGQVPFERDQEFAVAWAHVRDAIPAASPISPELPAAVDTVLAKAMAKDRAARYDSSTAFTDDLDAALHGETVTAGRLHLGRRRTAALGAALGIGLIAVAGIWYASTSTGRGLPAELPSPSTSPFLAAGSVSPSASPTPDVFPNEHEAAVMASLPTSYSATCQRGSYDPVQVAEFGTARPGASLLCPQDDANGVTRIVIQTFKGSMRDYTIDSAVGRVRLNPESDRWVASDCTPSARGQQRWGVAGTDLGSVECYRDPSTGAVYLYWSHTQSATLVGAMNRGGDAPTLYEWFQRNARFITP